MKAKGHCVWLVAKERKLGVNDSGVKDSGVNDGLRVKAVPRAAAVYDRQLKIGLMYVNLHTQCSVASAGSELFDLEN